MRRRAGGGDEAVVPCATAVIAAPLDAAPWPEPPDSQPMFTYFRSPVPWTELLRRTIADSIDDGVTGLAAQLAFYFFLALFPALLVLVSLLPLLPIEPAIGGLLSRMEEVLPSEGVSLVREEVTRLLQGDLAGSSPWVSSARCGAVRPPWWR